MVSSQVAQSPSCRAHKFGGSSLADASRIRHVASLMLGAGEPRQVVVVSAMQGTTNALIAMTTAAAAGEDWQAAWSALRTQHADAASALLEAPAELHAWIDARFADIADLLRAVSLLRQPGRAALDRIQGMGEVLSATLLQAHLRARGADYALLDARDVLLVRHAELGAVVDWDESARRLDAWRAANPQPRVVVTGFVAGGEDGLPTAGPQRQRFLRRDLRRPVRCRRAAHLVGCRRRALGRPAAGAGSGLAGVDELSRSLRAGLLRREGDPSADDDPGDRARPADPDAQHLQARVPRHPHRCRWRWRPWRTGEGTHAGSRPRLGEPGRRRPDRCARHGGACVRGVACGAHFGGDDLARQLRAFDLLGGARARCRSRASRPARRVFARARRRPGAGRAGRSRHQRAGRGRRRHGRQARRGRAIVRGPGACAGQHPRDRPRCVRAQHLGGHRRRRRHPRLACRACGVLAIAADAGAGGDRPGQGRRRPARSVAGGVAAPAQRSQRRPAPARTRHQPPHVALRPRRSCRLAHAHRGRTAARRPRRDHHPPAGQSPAACGRDRLQRQRQRCRAVPGMAGGRHPRHHPEQACRALAHYPATRPSARPARAAARASATKPPSVPACR
jgi:hypothetical protein